MVYQQTIGLKTGGRRDMHDITEQVARIVTAAGIGVSLVVLRLQYPIACQGRT
jgi:thiamine phosphate synthase YjbQ (UPF0047 family)